MVNIRKKVRFKKLEVLEKSKKTMDLIRFRYHRL